MQENLKRQKRPAKQRVQFIPLCCLVFLFGHLFLHLLTHSQLLHSIIFPHERHGILDI